MPLSPPFMIKPSLSKVALSHMSCHAMGVQNFETGLLSGNLRHAVKEACMCGSPHYLVRGSCAVLWPNTWSPANLLKSDSMNFRSVRTHLVDQGLVGQSIYHSSHLAKDLAGIAKFCHLLNGNGMESSLVSRCCGAGNYGAPWTSALYPNAQNCKGHVSLRCFVVPQTRVSDHTAGGQTVPSFRILEARQYILFRFPPAMPFIDHSLTTLKSIASGTCHFARETKWQQSPTWSLEKEGAHSPDHL
ncbi:hypothetical protein EDC04DRAFT_3091132 [Pisolithus marmoratus]|nr:hypothetical protein EDC04DRAFT_3091132 [Pisolithus marmoratus]